MTLATTPGREPVQVFELQQPSCAHTFGLAPCAATGSPDTKCYNTFATCRDTANFAFGTPLSLCFTTGKVAEMGIPGLPYVIPSLVSVSTSPTRLNLASSNPDAQGLGNRALCSIVLQDHTHSDRLVDPYLSGRSWDPLSRERGSFWTRWLARNRYRQNIPLKVYEGYAGQRLDQMSGRSYFLQSIKGPNSGGRITIQGKDILARLEERKAQAPLASSGVLYAAIDDSVTGFEVAGAVEADYPASGTLRVGGEIMTYTDRAASANGITFSGVVRGTDGTTPDSHSVDDGVQACLRYTNMRPDDLLEDLLVTHGGIDASYLSLDLWQAEVDAHLNAYRLSALITEPTGVSQLVSEVQLQATCTIWWDERKAMVDLKAIRGIDAAPPLLTDAAHIVEGSVSIGEKPRERVSRVWMFYNVIDPTGGVADVGNFRNQFIVANLQSETDRQYGEASIRKIFSRWLTSAALVQTTASRIITRYVEVPSAVRFRLDAKDRAIWVGDTVRISHHLDVDQYGDRNIRQWTIVSAEEVIPGETVEYVAEDTTLYGRIHYVMAPDAANYPGHDNAPFRNCYIGDADGRLGDGQRAGTIS